MAETAAGTRRPAPESGISTRSTACVRMKPSMQTITGVESSSARRNAWMWRSSASWLVSAYSWIQPRVALGHRVAVVVPDVDRRADRAVGDRHHDRQARARRRCRAPRSCTAGPGSPSPCRRAPRWREAPIATDIAANSDSTLTNSHGASSPALHELREVLDDVRLRGDRVRADHLRPAQRHRLGDRPRALNLTQHRSAPAARLPPRRALPARPPRCPRRPRRRSARGSR